MFSTAEDSSGCADVLWLSRVNVIDLMRMVLSARRTVEDEVAIVKSGGGFSERCVERSH